MTKREALRYFKNQSQLAEALGITRSAVSYWSDTKPIPEVHALKIRYVLKPEKFGAAPKKAAA
jgi:hypothetical protein